MNQQSKKTFSIFIAILIGFGIIFVTWKSQHRAPTETSAPKTASSDWKNLLSVIPQATSTKIKNATSTLGSQELTTTGAIAQDLMIRYLNAQPNEPVAMTDEDAALFADSLLVNNIPSSSIKKYSKSDFVIVEASTSTITTYKQGVEQAMSTLLNENSFDELRIVAQAVDTKDETKLIPLAKNVASYQKLLATLTAIKVPSTSADIHLYVTQSYAVILSGVIDMQKMISDPAIGLQGFAKYNRGVEMISKTGEIFSSN